MPQEMQVLRCYSCEAFQVHIVKKVPKWECKVCGEKQSVKKVYAKGGGKDCRLHVQQLNQIRLQKEEELNLLDPVAPSSPYSSYIASSDRLPENSTTSQFREFITTDTSSTDIENQGFECAETFEDMKHHDSKLNNIESLPSVQTDTEYKNILVTDYKKECNENMKTSRWSEFLTTDTDDDLHVDINNEPLDSTYERPNKKQKYTKITQHIKDEEELYLNVAVANRGNNSYPANISITEKEKNRSKYKKIGKSNEHHLSQNVKQASQSSKGATEFYTNKDHKISDNIPYVQNCRWLEFLSSADSVCSENEDKLEKPNDVYEKYSKQPQILSVDQKENAELKCASLEECNQHRQITSVHKLMFNKAVKDSPRTNDEIKLNCQKIVQNCNDGHVTSTKGLYENCIDESELETMFAF